MEASLFNSDFFSYIMLPAFIFCARICDVSLDTMRIIFVAKGKKNIAPILGFFEILIWIIAISKIMQNLGNYVNYVAYAAGFATGNFVGMMIEEKLAVGIQMIRIFAHERGQELLENLSDNGYGATVVEAHGAREKIHLIYTIIPRNELAKVLDLITRHNPKAFYTIEDIRSVREGIFPQKKTNLMLPISNIFKHWKKGK